MAGPLRRDKVQSIRGSRIAIAIVIGVLLGCIFAFVFPHGFLTSTIPIENRRIVRSTVQVFKPILVTVLVIDVD